MENMKNDATQLGSTTWNDEMYQKHPTPYSGIAGYIEKKRVKRIFNILGSRLKLDSVILEVGCEQGNMLQYFVEHFSDRSDVRIIGSDISRAALKDAAGKLGDRVQLIEHDITSDSLPDLPPVDILICSEALEHIPDYKKAIAQLAKVANDNTLVIITVPLEKYKNQVKRTLIRMKLFNLLFKGIEASLSEWHVNDFSKEDILGVLEPYFKVEHYSLLFGLHQIIVLRKK